MEPVASRKIHFAPLARQQKAITTLLREGQFRNVTDLMRRALDHYLAARGRPALDEQARMMAEDFAGSPQARGAVGYNPQDASRATDETW